MHQSARRPGYSPLTTPFASERPAFLAPFEGMGHTKKIIPRRKNCLLNSRLNSGLNSKAKKHKQLSLIPSVGKFQYNHGGVLRQKRRGRKQRPLSSKDAVHLVFKARREVLKESSFRGRKSFSLCHQILKKYARRFFVKIEQLSIQGDHIHLLIRCSRRSQFHAFFRVSAGQIAQVFQKQNLLSVGASVTDTPRSPAPLGRLWKYRPFTRVVKSFTALKIVRDYIQLNEQEALGKIRYTKNQLKGLSSVDWQILWC